jgi:hypothetical protein
MSDFKPENLILLAADDVSLLRSVDVQRVLEAACYIGDQELWETHKYLHFQRVDLRPAILESYCDIANLLEFTEVLGLRQFVRQVLRKQRFENLKDEIFRVFPNRDLTGLELGNSSGLYLLMLPDASAPGCVRSQYFDVNGISGHSTRNSFEQLLDEAVADGYRTVVTGKLNELSKLKSFKDGLAQVDKIARVNSGEDWKLVFGNVA